jgi:hypothetical protein
VKRLSVGDLDARALSDRANPHDMRSARRTGRLLPELPACRESPQTPGPYPVQFQMVTSDVGSCTWPRRNLSHAGRMKNLVSFPGRALDDRGPLAGLSGVLVQNCLGSFPSASALPPATSTRAVIRLLSPDAEPDFGVRIDPTAVSPCCQNVETGPEDSEITAFFTCRTLWIKCWSSGEKSFVRSSRW